MVCIYINKEYMTFLYSLLDVIHMIIVVTPKKKYLLMGVVLLAIYLRQKIYIFK